MLTGGEVFTQKFLLYATLNYLKTKPLKNIVIKTNGFWIKNGQSIKQVIEELKQHSSTPLSLSVSSTKYHREFGVPLPIIKKFLKENGQDEYVKISITQDSHWFWNLLAPQLIFPMGRGKSIAGKFNLLVRNRLAPCTAKGIGVKGSFDLENYFLYITNQGNVYGCCPHRHKELGNAFKTSVKDLLLLVDQQPYFRALNEGGVEKAALELGLTKEDIKRRTCKKWICDFCEELTNTFFKNQVVR